MAQPDRLLGGKAAFGLCADKAGLVLFRYRQADGNALVDRDGNFIVYDTRANQTAVQTLHQVRQGAEVNFVAGQGGESGAILVKTAWRILTNPGEQTARYVTVPGHIAVAAEDSADGRAHCLAATLGLLGMHIVRKPASGNGDHWIWSSFEHRDTAPLAGSGRDVNNILTNQPFPQGCPVQGEPRGYVLFANDQPATALNQPPEGPLRWATAPPFARQTDGRPAVKARVSRCWQVFSGTEALNTDMQAMLAGSVWSHYRLIGTQWRGNGGDPVFGTGELPRFLSNVTMETFMQPTGSCMSCHKSARMADGRKSDFSFIFQGYP